MKRIGWPLLVVLMGFHFLVSAAAPQMVVSDQDKALVEQKLNKFAKDKALPISELIFNIGSDLKGTPYVGKTLDGDVNEHLVINLHQLDCTTFVENCLALARTVRNGGTTVEQFAKELESIRYRKGILNGYTSRLHYFSDWIRDNETKGIVKDVTAQLGGENIEIHLNFMSAHPNLYPQLIENKSLVNEIRQIENRVSAGRYYYIPKEKIKVAESGIEDGDIAALVTNITGMDVSHVGLLFKKEGRVYFLHASSKGGKVEMTHVPMSEYLLSSKSTIGIYVVRAL